MRIMDTVNVTAMVHGCGSGNMLMGGGKHVFDVFMLLYCCHFVRNHYLGKCSLLPHDY